MVDEKPSLGLMVAFVCLSPILVPAWGVFAIYRRLRHR